MAGGWEPAASVVLTRVSTVLPRRSGVVLLRFLLRYGPRGLRVEEASELDLIALAVVLLCVGSALYLSLCHGLARP